jgi:hypothetical protein
MQVQAQNDTKTLFDGASELESWGVVLAPELSSVQIFDQNVAFGEIALGVMLNNKWYIGGYYGESMNNIGAPQEMLPAVSELEFQSYGMRIEYTVAADKLVHFSFPLNIGVFYAEEVVSSSIAYNEASYFAVMPGAQLELNVSKYIRVFGGARYRILVNEIENDPVIRDVDTGVSLHAGLRIGLFERGIN